MQCNKLNQSRCAGFTLMEVLVTVVILSIGLLGVAGLQLSSLKGNEDALMRSEAVLLAMDGADRLRANLAGVEAGHYNLRQSTPADPGCIDSNAGCTVSELANTDIFAWRTKVSQKLPMGMGVICLDSTPDDGTGDGNNYGTDPACDGLADNGINVYAVKVWWDHDRDGPPGVVDADGNPQSSSLMRISMEVIP